MADPMFPTTEMTQSPPWLVSPESDPATEAPPRRRRVSLWLVLALLLCIGAVVAADVYSSHATQRRRAALAGVATATSRLEGQRRDTRVAASSLAQTAGQGRTQLGSMTKPAAALPGIADEAHRIIANERQVVIDGETLTGPQVYNAATDQANRELDKWRSLLAALGKLDQQLFA